MIRTINEAVVLSVKIFNMVVMSEFVTMNRLLHFIR